MKQGREDEVAEREIDAIVWYEEGHRIVVVYVTGESDRLFGAAAFAATLAEEAGLRLVATQEGIHRWVHAEPA